MNPNVVSQELIEQQIISKIIQNQDYSIITKNNLKPSDFVAGYEKGSKSKDVLEFIKSYYEEYKTTPSKITVTDRFEDFIIRECNDSEKYLIEQFLTGLDELDANELLNIAAGKLCNEGYEPFKQYMLTNLNSVLKGRVKQYVGVDIIHEGFDSRLKRYEDGLANPTKTLLTTGFTELDTALGGWRREGELVIVQGKTGEGKTHILLKMLFGAWEKGENVCLYEPEMSPDYIGYRFDSFYSHLSNFSLSHAKEIKECYRAHGQELKSHDNKFDVITPKTFGGIPTVSKLKEYCISNNIGILGVDGITSEYLEDEKGNNYTKDYAQLTHITSDLYDLSEELKIPVIAIVQAQRLKSDDKVDNSTISGSYKISCLGTLAFALNNVKGDKTNNITLTMTKNRYGEKIEPLLYSVDLDTESWAFMGIQKEDEQQQKKSSLDHFKKSKTIQPTEPEPETEPDLTTDTNRR